MKMACVDGHDSMIVSRYPLVNVYRKLWFQSPYFSWAGETHEIDWAIFNSKLLNYQRVSWFIYNLIQ